MVLVNADPMEVAEVKLDREYYEPDSAQWIASILLRPRTAALLLRSEN